MRRFSTWMALVLLAGCGKDASNLGYDQAELDRFKAALPSESQLAAGTPTATTATRSIGQTAAYPVLARDIVGGVNGAVKGMVQLVHAIVDIPPTMFNSETHEFFWGPWQNDNDFGMVAAYIRELLPTAPTGGTCPSGSQLDTAGTSCVPDFHFVYALLRGPSADVTRLVPVIWGGANPDPSNPDFGSGVTLWDFEANYAFAEANDPGFATKDFARGRFVAVYGKGASTNAGDPPGATFAFNVAVFHEFVPQDKPADPRLTAQYFYGRYDGQIGVRFLDFHALADVNNPSDGLIEDLSVRLAALDSGLGRAEVSAQCPAGQTCSLAAGQVVSGVECWDTAVDRTFLNLSLDGTPMVTEPTGGTEALCGPIFQNTLDGLHIPKLGDVVPAMMAVLEAVAANGMPSGT